MDFGGLLGKAWKKYIDNIVNLVLFVLVGSLLNITIILVPAVIGGLMRGFLLYAREGKKPEFNELWNFEGYVQMLLLLLVGGIITMIGYMLLFIPGLIISILLMYSAYFIVDKNMDFVSAMKASKDLVLKSGFVNHFIIMLIMGVANGVGSALFGIGMLLTAPYGLLLMTIVFLETSEAKDEAPAAAPAK